MTEVAVENAPGESFKPLEIYLFGTPCARIFGQALPKTRSRKELHLLSLLALAGGSEVDRDVLAHALWPFPEEHARDQALGYLRRSLAELRRALGSPAENRIETPSARGLRLRLDDDCLVDVLRFDRAVRRLRQFGMAPAGAPAASRTGPREAALLCEEIVTLYRAPLLAGVDDAWAAAAREERRQAFRSAIQAYAVRAQAEGDASGAADLLRHAVAAEPLWEEGVRLLMVALVAAGEGAAAQQAYRTLVRNLRRSLGSEPEEETRALASHLGSGRSPLGTRFSGAAPIRPSDPKSLLPQGLRMRALPAPLTSLIGRDSDIAAVSAQLRQSRLVTLSGVGGVGKSRLALAVGAIVAARDEEAPESALFRDGVGLVELSALSDPVHVATTIAAALGITTPPNSERTALMAVASGLASRSLLLILDNCEHLREACARVAAAILGAAPRIRILATSRQPLGLIGEVTWRVPSLMVVPPLPSPPESDTTAYNSRMAQIVACPAVKLFLERAMARRPSFQLNDGNAEAVTSICRSLDGIPLALELAAAQIAVLSAPELAERLQQRIPLLAAEGVEGGNAPPRHRTLRSLISWSVDLLSESDSRLLARLSVFRDGWTLAAATRVVIDDPSGHALRTQDLERGLRLLVDHSLVSAEEDSSAGTRASVRFRTLETIRQFAAERLEAAGDREQCERRHARFFADWVADEAGPRLFGPGQTDWLRRLTADRENLRAALRYARTHGDASTLLRLAAGLWRFWMLRGEFQEGREWLEAALNSSGEKSSGEKDKNRDADDRERAIAAAASGLFADYAEGRAAGEARLAEGLRRAEALGEPRVRGLAALFAGYSRRHVDPSGALVLLETAEAHAVAAGDTWLAGEALSTRGYLELYHGDLERSETHFLAALPQARRCGDPDLTAQVLYHLGLASCRRGDPGTGRLYLEECLRLRRTQGRVQNICKLQCFLGRIALREGQDDEAQERLDEAWRLACVLGNRRYAAPTLEGLALLAEHQGKFGRAAELLGAAAQQRGTVDATLLPLWPEDAVWLEDRLSAGLGKAAFTFYFSRGQMSDDRNTEGGAVRNAADYPSLLRTGDSMAG